MAVLYRKYRPQTFGEVVGQKSIIKTLQSQLAAGQGAGVAIAWGFGATRPRFLPLFLWEDSTSRRMYGSLCRWETSTKESRCFKRKMKIII